MIIDIGSGHKPDKKANILLEYKDAGNEHRWNQDLKVDRPIVLYNSNKMPFKDKVFVKTICKHVLEHVDDPKQFLNEIERISLGGYIETPSELAELVFTPYAQHKWVINLVSNELLIKEKTSDNISKVNKLFDYLCDNEQGFEQYFYWRRRALFFIEYYWNDSIKFKMIPKSKNTVLDLWSDGVLKNLCVLNKASARRNTSFRGIKHKTSDLFLFLEKNIVTPCCQSDVSLVNKYFVCKACNKSYPILGNVVDLSLDK